MTDPMLHRRGSQYVHLPASFHSATVLPSPKERYLSILHCLHVPTSAAELHSVPEGPSLPKQEEQITQIPISQSRWRLKPKHRRDLGLQKLLLPSIAFPPCCDVRLLSPWECQ